MKIFQALFIVSTIISLSSCGANGTTDKERIIKNDSSDTIYVAASIPKNSNFKDTLLPGATKLLYQSQTFGSQTAADMPYDGVGALTIMSDENVTSTRNYKLESNWTTVIIKTSNKPEDYKHTYTYTVFDTDF